MSTKENGTPDQEGAASKGIHSDTSNYLQVSLIEYAKLVFTIERLDMSEFMPAAKIKMGQKGNPLWALEGRIQSIERFFGTRRKEAISPRDDLVFRIWHDAYLRHCRETGLNRQIEEDLFMLWCSCVANRNHPEKCVNLAFELAKMLPHPVEAKLFEGLPTMQLIVAALKVHAQLSDEGGRILCTNEQLAENTGKCRETTGRYIERLWKDDNPLLYRVTSGRKGSPSEYLFLADDVLSRAKLPDSTKALLAQASPSPCVNYVRRLLSECP